MPENETLFQLAVVGSSAGGIEALSKLVSSLPASFPIPLVIAQHLDPNRPSHLSAILGRHTQLPIVIVEQQQHLEPGTIYVVPSNNHVEITDHAVNVLQDGQGHPKPSVDLLLTSASQIFGEKLIAVILSGTGSDGTVGVREVHEAGGTVIVQNPATSAYPGMVQSLDPQTVDIVTDLNQIGATLGELVSGKLELSQRQSGTDLDLAPFLDHLRAYNGMDFRSYKQGTILRRLQRRLVVTDTPDLDTYRLYLETHPEEYENLIGSFLIKVTDFLRDIELFNYLKEQVLPELIEYSHTRNNNELRIWSAGCATGQEAYSLAIIFSEALGERFRDYSIKIFATDIDANAIAFARRGSYPAASLANLSRELVDRYFTQVGESYEVKKHIREMLVFGEHDLSQRAPFPRIDLVLCRNVLIYFSRELQQHALQLFAFALRDDGFLVLGRSESNSLVSDFFNPVEQGQRVYRRQGQRRLYQSLIFKNIKPFTPPVSAATSIPAPTLTKNTKPHPPRNNTLNGYRIQGDIQQSRIARENLLLKLPVGVVVVDDHYDIQEINTAARRLLSIHTTAIGEDFVHLAENVPPRELGGAITKAIRENTVTNLNQVEVPDLITGELTFLQIICYPHFAGNSSQFDSRLKGSGSEFTDSEDTVYPLTKNGSGNNNPTYALILINDVTSVVLAHQELKESNLQIASLADELSQNVAFLKSSNNALQERNEQLLKSNAELAQAKLQLANSDQQTIRVSAEFSQHLLDIQAANTDLEARIEVMKGRSAQQDKERVEFEEQNRQLKHQLETLVKANRNLLAGNEELTSTNSELRATSEEYVLYTEETQAAIEESETLNEEMQATNEELETLNEELQASVEELNTSNTDLAVQTDELRTRSEELKLQKQLNEYEKDQLAAILSSMGDAVLVTDLEGRIILTNPAYVSTFGEENDPKAKKGQTPILMDEAGIRALDSENTPRGLALKGESFDVPFSFIQSGGTRRWWEARGQTVERKGEKPLSVVVLRDNTELSLRRLQEDFLALVAHELRAPLTNIKGYNYLIQRWLDQNLGQIPGKTNPSEISDKPVIDTSKPEKYISIVLQQSDQLERLITDINDMSRLQNGKFKLNLAKVYLNELVREVIEVSQTLTSSNQIIELDSPKKGEIIVRGDYLRLQQVLINLINNAQKYAAQSPKIIVHLKKIKSNENGKGEKAEIRVQDFGPGIKAEYLKEVFSRFYQIMHTDNKLTSGGGLGLGLHISEQIVSAHSGTIGVESTEGEGTIFIVKLPLLSS